MKAFGLLLLLVLSPLAAAQSPDPVPPLPPQNLTIVSDPSGTVLQWEAPPGPAIDGYNIYRKGALLASVDSSTFAYVDGSGANATSAMTYFVTAFNEAGESLPSISIFSSCLQLSPPGVDPGTCIGMVIDVVFWIIDQVPPIPSIHAFVQPRFVKG